MCTYVSPETLWTVVAHYRVGHKIGRQRTGTVSWVLHDPLGPHHPLSPVIKLGIRLPRKKEKERNQGREKYNDINPTLWRFRLLKRTLFSTELFLCFALSPSPFPRCLPWHFVHLWLLNSKVWQQNGKSEKTKFSDSRKMLVQNHCYLFWCFCYM